MNVKLWEEISEPQEKFLKAKTRFVAYGGARGGGKSWAVRKKALLLALNYSGIKILIMRRTYAELKENHILPLLGEIAGIGTYKDTDKAINMINGSRIKFGYCDNETDVLQYQGQEYDIIFIDEATHLTEFQYSTITACLRGANKFPKRMYLTCNPGGVGHSWVKRLFIDKNYREGENPKDYTFIPAKVYDNKVLMENDPGYVNMLKALPEEKRKAWLDGDWNVYAGQYFTEFKRDLHIKEAFTLPAHWRRYRTLDYHYPPDCHCHNRSNPLLISGVLAALQSRGLGVPDKVAKIIRTKVLVNELFNFQGTSERLRNLSLGINPFTCLNWERKKSGYFFKLSQKIFCNKKSRLFSSQSRSIDGTYYF